MEKGSQRTIELHYDLFKDNCHTINALLYNKAEHNLILAIRYLNKFIDGEIQLNVGARREGSLIDTLQIIISNPTLTHVVDILFTALIANWFRPKLHKTEEIKNRVEIAEKIKSGNFTREEAESLLSEDKTLTRWCSNYYKYLHETREVAQITASVFTPERVIEQGTIEYSNFDEKIITTEEKTDTETIEGVTIHIVSPILTKLNKKLLWKGIYSGEPIDFKVEDSEFLKQVYGHEIKFGNGTYIICALTITTVTKTNDDGEVKVDRFYVIKDVTQWADDEHFQYYTKRYRKIQANTNASKQLNLFTDNEEV